jgi:hypothetical protein
MVLLEMRIPGQNVRVLRENETLGSFLKRLNPPKGTSLCETVYRSSKSEQPFLLGAVTRDEENKSKKKDRKN